MSAMVYQGTRRFRTFDTKPPLTPVRSGIFPETRLCKLCGILQYLSRVSRAFRYFVLIEQTFAVRSTIPSYFQAAWILRLRVLRVLSDLNINTKMSAVKILCCYVRSKHFWTWAFLLFRPRVNSRALGRGAGREHT